MRPEVQCPHVVDQWPPQAPSFREGSRRPEPVIDSKDIAGPAGGTPGPGGRKTRRACEDPVPLKTPEASGPSRKAPPRGVARNPGLQAGVVHEPGETIYCSLPSGHAGVHSFQAERPQDELWRVVVERDEALERVAELETTIAPSVKLYVPKFNEGRATGYCVQCGKRLREHRGGRLRCPTDPVVA